MTTWLLVAGAVVCVWYFAAPRVPVRHWRCPRHGRVGAGDQLTTPRGTRACPTCYTTLTPESDA